MPSSSTLVSSSSEDTTVLPTQVESMSVFVDPSVQLSVARLAELQVSRFSTEPLPSVPEVDETCEFID